MTNEEKLKNLKKMIEQASKDFGIGAVMHMSDNQVADVESISTGSLGLDLALGIGGLPKGRVVEIMGPESSGKSTLCQHIIAEAQKAGGIAAYIDVEHSFHADYAQALGVQLDKLYLSQPNSAQEALNLAERYASTGAIDVIVIDSVAALVSQEELDRQVGESTMGVTARLMGQGLRKLTPIIAKNNVLLVFVNQIRMKLGVMYGSPETTPGGEALKYFSTVRLDIRPREVIKEKDEAIARTVRVKVIKNKIAPPFKETLFTIVFGKGIDQEEEILGIAIEFGIVQKGGAWLKYKDYNIQGQEKFQQLMNDNPELKEEIKQLVIAKINENKS